MLNKKTKYKEYYDLNKEDLNFKKRKYYEENRIKILNQKKKYYEENKEKIIEGKKDYEKMKYNTDILYNLSKRVRRRIYKVLLSKKICTFEIIGCTSLELKKYLENKFIKNMSWENRNLWHIDHIIPLATAKTEEEIYKLCHYTNLQPLWARENLSKGKKINYKHI